MTLSKGRTCTLDLICAFFTAFEITLKQLLKYLLKNFVFLMFRIVFLGGRQSGKTSIISQFLYDSLPSSYRWSGTHALDGCFLLRELGNITYKLSLKVGHISLFFLIHDLINVEEVASLFQFDKILIALERTLISGAKEQFKGAQA